MAGSDDGPTYHHASTEELRRQAESAFGGPVDSGPVGVPGSDEARLRRRRRILIGFVALALTLGTVVAAGVLIAAIDSDDSDKPASTVPAIPSLPGVPSTPGVPAAPEPPEQPQPSPSEPASFFTTGGLRQGMDKARRLAGAGARVELARITSEQINVVANSGSQRKIVLVSEGFTRAITSPSGASTGREFAFSAIDPRAAARLDRAIDRPIRYMVVIRDPISRRVEWLVYPEGGGGHYEADARGRSLRRVG
jgi:hypothetical protein